MPKTSTHPILLAQSGHEHLVNFKFQLNATWAACRLCGAVFQSDLDRTTPPIPSNVAAQAYQLRQQWRAKHEAQNHTAREIADLEKSGLAITPEAAYKLAPYGIVPIGDVGGLEQPNVIDHALWEAPRAPTDDCES